jgi:hypothetical protein
MVELHARRAVDPQRPAGGVAERIALERLGLDDEPVQLAGERLLPRAAECVVDSLQGHRPRP